MCVYMCAGLGLNSLLRNTTHCYAWLFMGVGEVVENLFLLKLILYEIQNRITYETNNYMDYYMPCVYKRFYFAFSSSPLSEANSGDISLPHSCISHKTKCRQGSQ